jgi:predicted methyltransferase
MPTNRAASEDLSSANHMPQLQHNMWLVAARSAVLSVITGGGKWVEITRHADRSTSTSSSPPPSGNSSAAWRAVSSLACSGFEPRQKNSDDSRTLTGSPTQQRLPEVRALTVKTNTQCPRKPVVDSGKQIAYIKV